MSSLAGEYDSPETHYGSQQSGLGCRRKGTRRQGNQQQRQGTRFPKRIRPVLRTSAWPMSAMARKLTLLSGPTGGGVMKAASSLQPPSCTGIVVTIVCASLCNLEHLQFVLLPPTGGGSRRRHHTGRFLTPAAVLPRRMRVAAVLPDRHAASPEHRVPPPHPSSSG